MKIVRNNQGARYVPPGHDEAVTARKLFDPGNGCRKVDVHITTFAPGAGMAEETHADSDHILYLMKGKLEVRQGGKSVVMLEEGDAIHIPAGEAHQMVNPTREAGTFFVVTTPPV
jgi:quercetin dioxygenase-like cupin family protein